MPRTTNKGVRFTDAELEHIEKLRAQLPEYSSDADLLHHAALLGILVLAPLATRPGLTPYAGYAPDDLAALLRPRLLPAIDFLVERGGLPIHSAMQHPAALAASVAAETRPEPGTNLTIDAAVADDLQGFGSGFMDDD